MTCPYRLDELSGRSLPLVVVSAIFDRGRLLNVAVALQSNSAIAGLCAAENTTDYDQSIVNKRSRELAGRLDDQRRARL